jgi:hypothetical protein
LDETDLTIHPTMLTDVTPQMKILQDEIFAPVLPVMTYDTLDQAISYIEARDKPLALYVYSPNETTVSKCSRTSSGGVTVNGVFSRTIWKTTSPSAASTRAAWAAITACSGSRPSRTSGRCTGIGKGQPSPFQLWHPQVDPRQRRQIRAAADDEHRRIAVPVLKRPACKLDDACAAEIACYRSQCDHAGDADGRHNVCRHPKMLVEKP